MEVAPAGGYEGEPYPDEFGGDAEQEVPNSISLAQSQQSPGPPAEQDQPRAALPGASDAVVVQSLYDALAGHSDDPAASGEGGLADLVLDVFRLYAARGNRLNDTTVSHANFLALLRAGGLVAAHNPTAIARADVIYTKVLRGARARHGLFDVLGHDRGLTTETLPWALALVAVESAPRILGLAPREHMRLADDVPFLLDWLARGLVAAADAHAPLAESRPLGGGAVAAAVAAATAALDSPAASAALARADGVLRRLFFGYTRPEGTARRGGAAMAGAGAVHTELAPRVPAVGLSVVSQTGGLDWRLLSQLAGHYRIAPGLVSKAFLFGLFSGLATPSVDSAGRSGGAAALSFPQVRWRYLSATCRLVVTAPFF